VLEGLNLRINFGLFRQSSEAPILRFVSSPTCKQDQEVLQRAACLLKELIRGTNFKLVFNSQLFIIKVLGACHMAISCKSLRTTYQLPASAGQLHQQPIWEFLSQCKVKWVYFILSWKYGLG